MSEYEQERLRNIARNRQVLEGLGLASQRSAQWHGGCFACEHNASGLTFNDAVREAPPETRSSEGGGVWAEYLPKVTLKSTDLVLMAVLMTSIWAYTDLAGGRGAVATAQPSPLDRAGFLAPRVPA